MIYFSENFVAILIYASLALTSIGAVSLLALIVRDARNRDIW